MNKKLFLHIGLVVLFVIAVIVIVVLIFGNSDSCKTKRFQKAFGHPLFLSQKRSALFASYDIGKYKKVSAEYPLSSAKFKAVEKEEAVDPFECAKNMLVVKFDDSSAKWCFEDGPNIDGRPDEVDGYKFANLPKKVQKKLLKKFRKARKYLIKGLEKDIAIHFKVKKPKN